MVKNTGMCLAPFIPCPAVSLIWSCVEDYHEVAWYTDTGMARMMYGVMTRQRSHSILQPVTLYLGAPGEKFSARSLTWPGCYSTPGYSFFKCRRKHQKHGILYLWWVLDKLRPFDRDGLCQEFVCISFSFARLCPGHLVPHNSWLQWTCSLDSACGPISL